MTLTWVGSPHLANIGWRAVAGQAPDPLYIAVLVIWRYRVDEGRS
jgi:hypothetical protein